MLPSPKNAGVARANKMAGGNRILDAEESKDDGIRTRSKTVELSKKVVAPETIKKDLRPNLYREKLPENMAHLDLTAYDHMLSAAQMLHNE